MIRSLIILAEWCIQLQAFPSYLPEAVVEALTHRNGVSCLPCVVLAVQNYKGYGLFFVGRISG